MPKDLNKPTTRKASQKKAPFHRATPSRNVVFLDNGVVTRRAPLSRQLPTYTSRPGSSAPHSMIEHIAPNAGAHAVGSRNRVGGFPTSSLRSTFNIASPFVQSAPLPPISNPSQAGSPEARIESTHQVSIATSGPTVLSWHIENEEEAARGYEGLKFSSKGTGGIGPSHPSVDDASLAPSIADHEQHSLPSIICDSLEAQATTSSSIGMPTRTLRKRPVRQAAAGSTKDSGETRSAVVPRRKRRSEAIADENAPSPKKADSRATSLDVASNDEVVQTSVGVSINSDLEKPSVPSKVLKRQRTSHTPKRVRSCTNKEILFYDSPAAAEDVNLCFSDSGAPQTEGALVHPHTPMKATPSSSSTPKRTAKRTRALRQRQSVKTAGEPEGRPDAQTTSTIDMGEVDGPPSSNIREGCDTHVERGRGHSMGEGLERSCSEDIREPLRELATAMPQQVEAQAGVTELPEGFADAVVAVCPGPQDGDTPQNSATSSDSAMEDDRRQVTTDELMHSLRSPSGPVQDIGQESPLATDDPSEQITDVLTDPAACMMPLILTNPGSSGACTAAPPNDPEPGLAQSTSELDGGLVDFDMEAALDVMLSGGQLNEAQLAALTPHIIGAGSEWDVSAADGAVLNLETHMPDLTLADWDMEELLRDSSGCMLGLEDYLAHSVAHTTTPADLSEAIPTLEGLELDMLGLDEHLLPLVDLEAPVGDLDAVASLGLDLNFELVAPPLDAASGVPDVSVGDCEAALPADGFEFGRLGLVAVDPTMFESSSDEELPALGPDYGELYLPLDIQQLDSVAPVRATPPRDDNVMVLQLQAGREATPLKTIVPVDTQSTSHVNTSPKPLAAPQLHVQGGNTPSLVTLAMNDPTAGSVYLGSATVTRSGPQSVGHPSTAADGSRQHSLSIPSLPTIVPSRQSDSSALSVTASSVTTAQPFLPSHPMAPRLLPIALPDPCSFQSERAVSPQPVVEPSPHPESAATSSANTPNPPLDVAPRAEAAWSTMFRQLKQTKKAVPVRRRIGVLRRYEEGRESRHGDTSEVRAEDALGGNKAQDLGQAIPPEGSHGMNATTDFNVTEKGDGRTEGPEVIVIEDSDDEQSQGKNPYKCPICARKFKLPNGLAIHLKWHYGETSLDWKRGIGRHGRIFERAQEARENAAARARELAEAHNTALSSSGTASADTAELDSSNGTRVTPTFGTISTIPLPGPSSMPLIPANITHDPFDFLVAPRQHDDMRNFLHIDANAPAPIHAAAIDINVGTGAQVPAGLSSTPDSCPGTSSYSDEGVQQSGQHPEPSWSEELFGSEADPSEAKLDDCTSPAIRIETNIMASGDVHLCEEQYRENGGHGLELGLSPLTGFASLQLLQ